MPNIVFLNRKGGVGKTTTTVNVAGGFLDADEDVSVWDMDTGQGDTAQWAQSAGIPSYAPVFGDLRTLIVNQGHAWNLIDTPPTDERAMLRGLLAADIVIVPVVLASLDIRGLQRALNTIQTQITPNYNPTVRVLISRYAPRHLAKKREILAITSLNICQTVISNLSILEESYSHGQTVFQSAPQSKALFAYRRLVKEIISWPH